MTRDDIICMAQEAGIMDKHDCSDDWFVRADIDKRNIFVFAALVAAEKQAQMVIRDGWRKCVEGQRTTKFCGLLDAAVKAEREACAEVCEEKQNYSMPIPCPDGISGCCVNHVIPARREKTGTECAAAIRSRGEKND